MPAKPPEFSDRGTPARKPFRTGLGSRRGTSLVELLVALTILGVGGVLASRLLVEATRELEGAEIGLRAALLLGEIGIDGTATERPAGPGRLIVVMDGGTDGLMVRYLPPVHASAESGTRGFAASRTWRLERDAVEFLDGT